MTPDQQRQIALLRGRINSMRQGGTDDAMIRAGLLREGWGADHVTQAMMAAPMSKPGEVIHEGVRKNEHGMFEVFHRGHMIARLRSEAEAWTAYNIAHLKTTGKIRMIESLSEISCRTAEVIHDT